MSFVRLSAHLLFQATKLALLPAFCPQYRHGGAFMANEEHLRLARLIRDLQADDKTKPALT
jgi:hypothetical protein